MGSLRVLAVVVCAILLFSVVFIPLTNADWTMFRADPTHSGEGTGNAVLTPTSLWNYNTGGFDIDSSPAVVNGVVYVGTSDDTVYALNAATGAFVWSYQTNGPVESSPAVVNGVV
jgi:outer membrane protein assembly factor BamB